MGKGVMMAMVIGASATGLAAVSQTENTLRPTLPLEASAASESDAGKVQASSCRIEKTLRYDFEGNPYMKKVRICA